MKCENDTEMNNFVCSLRKYGLLNVVKTAEYPIGLIYKFMESV